MSMQSWRLADFLARSTDADIDQITLLQVINGLPSLGSGGPWLAGGALRRTIQGKEPDSDFDFFFRDADQLVAFRDALLRDGFRKVRETEHHIHLRGKPTGSSIDRDIQCIRFRYYQTAEDVIDSFDFTICQFAYDGTTLTCGDFSLFDLGRKRLAIHKITYPVATMRRLIKYTKQGFYACSGALTAILRETAQSAELQQQLHLQYVD